MSELAVIVVGYNRIPSMLRLLESLENADYGKDEITLIISLDNCGNDSVERAAKEFVWTHGEKRIRTFPERQGLRNHILSCGNFLNEFDALAVLEDDIVVSPAYYNYMKQAVEFYKEDDDIAGISLYTHRINVNVNTPFIPEPGRSDVFFLQFAQSWGQIWLKEQWFKFRNWYEENKDLPLEADNIPEYVSKWPKTSWLKFHIKYCIDQDKYFVYPYDSLSTCFSDIGEHCKETNSIFQVPMLLQSSKIYRFYRLQDDVCRYDAFFERQGLGKYINISEEQLCVDLYGSKNNRTKKRFLLTMKALPYNRIKGFSLTMRPHEDNIIFGVDGEDIFLYDTIRSMHNTNKKKNGYLVVSYYYNITAGWKAVAEYFFKRITKKISR